jgi:hypothetical protein
MKPRKVAIVLEVETNLPLEDLRRKEWWRVGMTLDGYDPYDPEVKVLQVQVNVIKPEK